MACHYNLRFLLAFALTYALGSAAILLSKASSKSRWVGFLVLSSLLFACPVLVPDSWFNLRRLIITAAASFFWMKAFDVISRPRAAGDANVAVQIRHLLNLGSLVAIRSRSGAPSDHHQRRRDVLVWLPAFLAATLFLCGAFAVHWIQLSFAFWLEHTVKMVAIAFWGVTALNLHAALWRLAGVRSVHSPASALVCCTPAEFWRRWNRPVGEWLHFHVFQRIRTKGRNTGAILATFAVSGLLHEYFVSMIARHITGLPTAFFLIQGVAVAATFSLAIKPRWLPVAAVFTFLFMVGTAPLLFSPFNRVMPFYQNPLPAWFDFPFTQFIQPAREAAASGLGQLRAAGLMSADESSQAAAHALPGERPRADRQILHPGARPRGSGAAQIPSRIGTCLSQGAGIGGAD